MITGQEVPIPKEPLIVKFSDRKTASQDIPLDQLTDPKAIAEYSADLLLELRDLAHGAKLTFLAYLIQVAVEEAKIQAEEHK